MVFSKLSTIHYIIKSVSLCYVTYSLNFEDGRSEYKLGYSLFVEVHHYFVVVCKVCHYTGTHRLSPIEISGNYLLNVKIALMLLKAVMTQITFIPAYNLEICQNSLPKIPAGWANLREWDRGEISRGP